MKSFTWVLITVLVLLTARAGLCDSSDIADMKKDIADLHQIVKELKIQLKNKDAQLKELRAQIAALGGKGGRASGKAGSSSTKGREKSSTTPSRWTEILGRADKTHAKGKWQKHHNKQFSVNTENNQQATLEIPIQAGTNYGLMVRFARFGGNREIAFVVPVGDRAIRVVLGRQYPQQNNSGPGEDRRNYYAAGLEFVGGKNIFNNDTLLRRFVLANGPEHTLAIRVLLDGDQADVAVAFDNTRIIHWRGNRSALSAFTASGDNEPKNVVLLVDPMQTVIFHSVEMMSLPKDKSLDEWKQSSDMFSGNR